MYPNWKPSKKWWQPPKSFISIISNFYAEKILSQEKSVAVIDSNNKVVGIVKPSKVIHTVFGGRKENS